MKKTILLLGVILFGFFFGCERDDICSQDKVTTPRLVIEFYDNTNRDTPKNIANLRVQGVGNNQPLPDYTGSQNTSQLIYLPLKTDIAEGEMGTTQFVLTKDYGIDDNDTPNDPDDDILIGNSDTITISYSTREEYVSRACGYKTVFENISIVRENEADENYWIFDLEPVEENIIIENEKETHYKIYN
ncbi:DUF6452 family protein [Mangrovimonas aestuarii]|uniref:DUF6452 family protein n=1 Tax=Mangrovimonas aestuarii TaxID=3018443 RepID=UPI0023790279|nr:DUF6452 family protein [Mangrovimonas aestuarii]